MAIWLSAIVAVGAVVTLAYHVVVPAPRITFGDPNRDQWTSAAFSSDGKSILAGGRPNTLKLWNAATGEPIRQYRSSSETPTQQIYGVGFSPDGKHVFACGPNRNLDMWDAKTGKELLTYSDKGGVVQCYAIAPDGLTLLIHNGYDLSSFDVPSGKLHKSVSIEEFVPSGVGGQLFFSKDGKHFMFVDSPVVSIWDYPELKARYMYTIGKILRPEREFKLPVGVALHGFKLAADGQNWLYCTVDGRITELEIATAKEKRSIQLKTDDEIHVLSVSPKGDRIMTTGFHGRTRLYSFPEGKELKQFPGYGDVQFSPDGKSALTFTKDGRMMLWDVTE